MTNISNSINEKWVDIKGYEGLYKISTYSSILTVQNNKLRKPVLRKGYLRIGLQNKNGVKYFSLHRLVAQAFIPNPHNYPIINHINGVKNDNRIENLEWCTIAYNTLHSSNTISAGLKEFYKRKRSSSMKFTILDIHNMYEMSKKDKLLNVAANFNIPLKVLNVLLRYVHPDY